MFIPTQKCNCGICQKGGICQNVNGYTINTQQGLDKLSRLIDLDEKGELPLESRFELDNLKHWYIKCVEDIPHTSQVI